ncbi:MAG: tetratricopeptide repeat protein, partial [Polyangiaceae bacterium]|nr:tetratricopeptide repeat protein [Polyangiaceae bacterium]
EIAIIRKRELGDLRGAIDALDKCVERVPSDVEGRVALADLLVETGEIDQAIGALETASSFVPGRASTYRTLHDLLVRQGRIDQAYSSSAVLCMLNAAHLGEQLFCDQHHPGTRPSPCHQLEESAWAGFYPTWRHRSVADILDIVAPHAVAYRLGLFGREGRLAVLDPETRQDLETSTVSLVRSFVWASEVLGIPLPDIYVADEVPGGIAAVPADVPTAVVGRSVLSGWSLSELAFIVGRDLTYFRPSHYVLVLYSSIKELAALFLATIYVVRLETALPDDSKLDIRELAEFIGGRLTDGERERLRLAVLQFEKEGVRADLMSWARSIEVAAGRTGLLLCGDISVANRVLASEDRTVGNMTARDRIHDLIPFSVSRTHADLRKMLGISVG